MYIWLSFNKIVFATGTIREMQITTRMRYHSTPTKMAAVKDKIVTSVGENVGKSVFLYMVD